MRSVISASGSAVRSPYSFDPIGVVHSPFGERAAAPRQASLARDAEGSIELFAGRGYEDALEGLARWDYAWVIFVFHKNVEEGRGWRPKVLPPRSDTKRGLFATRVAAPAQPDRPERGEDRARRGALRPRPAARRARRLAGARSEAVRRLCRRVPRRARRVARGTGPDRRVGGRVRRRRARRARLAPDHGVDLRGPIEARSPSARSRTHTGASGRTAPGCASPSRSGASTSSPSRTAYCGDVGPHAAIERSSSRRTPRPGSIEPSSARFPEST